MTKIRTPRGTVPAIAALVAVLGCNACGEECLSPPPSFYFDALTSRSDCLAWGLYTKGVSSRVWCAEDGGVYYAGAGEDHLLCLSAPCKTVQLSPSLKVEGDTVDFTLTVGFSGEPAVEAQCTLTLIEQTGDSCHQHLPMTMTCDLGSIDATRNNLWTIPLD